MKLIGFAGAIAAVSLVSGNAVAHEHRCMAFSELSLVLEQNATDGDTEVVLFAKGLGDGLARLSIAGPHGRTLAKFKGDRRGIGIREFALESAEPPELDRVLASFPEGTYLFAARTVEGDCLRGSAPLSHEIAPQSVIETPGEGEVVPSSENLVVSWAPAPSAVVYLIEVKNEDTENAMPVEVPAPETSFTVPASWLQPGVASGRRAAT